jgi:predicted DCC family thiol-disulfide oxidoreductase YuxK
MTPVTGLTIIYDAACGLCTRTKEWILQQASLVDLQFVAGGSPEARTRFPQLGKGELAVVANTGEVWIGDHAWIVCLWALREYRDLSFRLTSPGLLLMAREAFTLVSKNRAALSELLRIRDDREMEQHLRSERWLGRDARSCRIEDRS